MAQTIMVVDPSEGFAMLLVDELQRQGYQVRSCVDGAEALAAVQSERPDLALLDMGLEEPDALTLAGQLRAAVPMLRLVLMPMMGETVPTETLGFQIQGLLPKPFFLPDLPGQIEAAFKAPLGVEPPSSPPSPPSPSSPPSPAPAEPTPPAPVKPTVPASPASVPPAFARHRREIQSLMNVLAREVTADAVLLTVGERLELWVGRLEEPQVQVLARAVIQGQHLSTEIAQALGREPACLEHNIAGKDYGLYALSLGGNAMLAVAVRGASALGLLRHRARIAVEEIVRLSER